MGPRKKKNPDRTIKSQEVCPEWTLNDLAHNISSFSFPFLKGGTIFSIRTIKKMQKKPLRPHDRSGFVVASIVKREELYRQLTCCLSSFLFDGPKLTETCYHKKESKMVLLSKKEAIRHCNLS